jgi:hypothetical protein
MSDNSRAAKARESFDTNTCSFVSKDNNEESNHINDSVKHVDKEDLITFDICQENLVDQQVQMRLFYGTNELLIWCDGHEMPPIEEMVRLGYFRVTNPTTFEIEVEAEDSKFSTALDRSLKARLLPDVVKRLGLSENTVIACKTLAEKMINFALPKHLLGNLPPIPEEIQSLSKSYKKLIKQMSKLPREEGVLLFTEWIKTQGTFYEARACEVAGERRTKRINAEKVINGEPIERKRSLSVKRMKEIPYLVEKSGSDISRLLGRELPQGYDTSQTSVSAQAEILFGL